MQPSLRTRAFRLSWLFALPYLLLPDMGLAQEPPAVGVESAQERSEEQARLSTLSGLLESIAVIESEIEELEKEYRDAETDEQKRSFAELIEADRARIEGLENDFSVLAAGIDRRTFFEQSVQEFDWREELEAVFAPVLAELKQASAYPREIDALRSELLFCERRLPLIDEALVNLDSLSRTNQDKAVGERLAELVDLWTSQRDELAAHYDSTQQRLAEKEEEKVGLAVATAEILRVFFKKRLINLLSALAVFIGIFLLLRYLHRLVHRYTPPGGSHTRQLMVRLADISYYLFTIVVAVGALLVALYLSADWLLLTLAVLVLIGVAWAARNAVPLFLEQAKLLLNVGAVREGERLIYKGVPWRVASLSLFSELENPQLRGGTLRLPLKDLAGLRSRLGGDDEPWFPSRIGDWVVLSDDTYGEVVEQTPETVVVSTVRGSYKHYPTVDYLAHHPKNLSSNFFSVNDTVSLDYSYREIVNSEIAPRIKAFMEDALGKEAYGEDLVQVIVELKRMEASSLDLITIAKFKGSAASEYFEIGWKLQQLALDACNQGGWKIPYPQLTLHHAE